MITQRLSKRHAALRPIGHGFPGSRSTDNQGENIMIRTAFKSAAAIGALYTSNWGISFAPGDGQVLRIVP
jgi:hypothetical protein